MRHRALTASLVALALLLASCGGDDETTTETTAPPGETTGEADPAEGGTAGSDAADGGDIAAGAESACAGFRSELGALEGELDEAASATDFTAAIDEALPGLERDAEELEALAGAEASGALAQLAESQAEAVRVVGEMRDAAEAEDVDEIQALGQDLQELSTEADRLADRAGVECAADVP